MRRSHAPPAQPRSPARSLTLRLGAPSVARRRPELQIAGTPGESGDVEARCWGSESSGPVGLRGWSDMASIYYGVYGRRPLVVLASGPIQRAPGTFSSSTTQRYPRRLAVAPDTHFLQPCRSDLTDPARSVRDAASWVTTIGAVAALLVIEITQQTVPEHGVTC